MPINSWIRHNRNIWSQIHLTPKDSIWSRGIIILGSWCIVGEPGHREIEHIIPFLVTVKLYVIHMAIVFVSEPKYRILCLCLVY